MHRERLPEDVHPRILIQAIQDNLGITKKEISERTGISYGTLNRYTRTPTSIGRPRRTSIERLRKLHAQSLSPFATSRTSFDTGASASHPGAAHRAALLGGQARPGREVSDPLDLHEMPHGPFLKFLRRLSDYAQADVAHFVQSDCRDRSRLLETRELVGDLYLSLISDLVDCVAPAPAPVTTPTE